MPTPTKNTVHLYNTREEIQNKSVPYSTDDGDELSVVISMFVVWARMIARYPNLAARYGTAHIQLATDLRAALKASQENRLYPKIVLPMGKYFSAKLLQVISESIEDELAAMIEQENQRWAEEYPARKMTERSPERLGRSTLPIIDTLQPF